MTKEDKLKKALTKFLNKYSWGAMEHLEKDNGRDNMNITQLEKEIIRVLKINENVDWDFSDIPPKEEFKELQIFIKRLFKEYRGQE
jgi:hypothetical protein